MPLHPEKYHYELLAFSPPVVEDGNGRLGRLWQTLILTRWRPLVAVARAGGALVHARQTALGATTGAHPVPVRHRR